MSGEYKNTGASGRWAMCEGKEQYRTANLALKVVRRRNRKQHHEHAKLEPYHCPCCNQWHIGAATSAHKRARLRRLTDNS